jgi:hypothetical protein
MSMRNGPVPIQAAADVAGIDVWQIRRWADLGSVEIQQRGGVETVVLELVMAMAASARRRRPGGVRDSLRARLADAKVQDRSVSDLQQIARGDSNR